MNILILTGKFGSGHLSAAASLRQQLADGFPDSTVDIVDFSDYALPGISEMLYKSFRLLVTHAGALFNAYYMLSSLGRPGTRPPLAGLLSDRMAALLGETRPDAVIATHPLCARLVSMLKETTGIDLPLITCITDVSAHPEWISPHTDCYLAPTPDIRTRLVTKGVDPSAVCVTGIPVREEFRHITARHAEGTRRLLVMGGGFGLLPENTDFYETLNAIPDTETTVITGHNQKLYQKLSGRFAHVRVLGYTGRIWEYMAQADLIVTKPGGITLFETIFSQVPVFLLRPSLQQERSNARWLTDRGIGWMAGSKNCAWEIRLLLDDTQLLANARKRMAHIKEQLEAKSLYAVLGAIAQAEGAA